MNHQVMYLKNLDAKFSDLEFLFISLITAAVFYLSFTIFYLNRTLQWEMLLQAWLGKVLSELLSIFEPLYDGIINLIYVKIIKKQDFAVLEVNEKCCNCHLAWYN